MKATRRHELEHNELADALGRWLAAAQPYSRAIAGAIVLLVAVAISYWFVTSKRAEGYEKDWDIYARALNTGNFDGLRDLVADVPGTVVAHWAQLAIAENDLARGSDVFRNRTEAPKLLLDAAKGFEALRGSADATLQQRALFGAARAHESLVPFAERPKETLAQAIDEWQTLAKKYPDGPFAETAQRRAADLQTDAARSFYEWLASWQPPKDFTREPGTPGKLDFDTDLDRFPVEDETPLGKQKALPTEEGPERPGDATDEQSPADNPPAGANAPASPTDEQPSTTAPPEGAADTAPSEPGK